MELPYFFLVGNRYKKTTRPHPYPVCAPCVDISVSEILLTAMRLMFITENQVVDIRPVGLLGNA